MLDQAEGLRRKRKPIRILSVLSLAGQADSADIAWRLALAWSRLGGRPLLVDGTGRSAARLLGCQPLHEWSRPSSRRFADCVLMQQGLAVIGARACPAGDAELTRQALMEAYSDLVFDAGAVGEDDAPLDASSPQNILLLAGSDQMETVYALLKGLAQMQSPGRIWLPWHNQSPEAARLEEVCRQRLSRVPRCLGDRFVSHLDHEVKRNGFGSSLRDSDFRSIVATMLAEQSARGEETPRITQRHA